ncbi:N-succinylarginine dihydrolase, partial [Cutibacterium acnes]
SEAVARLHQLNAAQRVFIQQNPAVIDQGVFHNDVIAVSNGPVLFHHQQAFLDQARAFAELEQKLNALDSPFIPIEVPTELVAVQDAVDSYLFNSQLLTKANGKMLIVVPEESRQNPRVWAYLQQLISSGGPIDEVKVFDLRESMCNGGGPACLRLRVVLNASELKATNSGCLMDDQR